MRLPPVMAPPPRLIWWEMEEGLGLVEGVRGRSTFPLIILLFLCPRWTQEAPETRSAGGRDDIPRRATASNGRFCRHAADVPGLHANRQWWSFSPGVMLKSPPITERFGFHLLAPINLWCQTRSHDDSKSLKPSDRLSLFSVFAPSSVNTEMANR